MSTLPTPPAEFLRHLSNHPQTPTRELLRPYLSFEAWLRKAFARGDLEIDGLTNLVPVYNGHEDSFRIRTIDYQTANREKYLMPLPDDKREEDGAPAIMTSLKEYRRNFDAFTHDWSNIVVAGSAALLPLLSRRKDVVIRGDPAVEDPLETYFQTVARASDIDIFFYGLDDEDAAIGRIIELEAIVRRNQRLFSGKGLSLRSRNAITFISPKWPYRHVQIILRLYKSISEILTGFDVDCACVAFDGKQVYTNPRGVTAIATRTNSIDLSRRSPSYENRLWKYRNQNFEVFCDSLERSRIDQSYFEEFVYNVEDLSKLTGLARLVFSEAVLNRPYRSYWRKRYLQKIDDGGEPALTTPSGYASHDIPYGEQFTADKVCEYVKKHSKEPYLFGTLEEVVIHGAQPSRKRSGELAGKVTFIKDNPGRQMIGSFYPLNEDDW
ncbi:ankyrin repeat protein [Xylaria sp. FL0933]|nr:ankyrin repeat protein [Xylaria sp. FL0933]